MTKRNNKGFTLIELMVVIVIIGILSALAIPKMFGVSSKAKAAEAPGVIANFETLQSAYAQETGQSGGNDLIGFTVPTSMWFNYANSLANGAMGADATVAADVATAFGSCVAGTDMWSSTYMSATDTHVRAEAGTCPELYTPNFD